MKKLIIYTWDETGSNKPFGVFTSQSEADAAIKIQAQAIGLTSEQLKINLYIFENVTLNEIYPL